MQTWEAFKEYHRCAYNLWVLLRTEFMRTFTPTSRLSRSACHTHTQRNLLHGRLSFSVAEEQHALLASNHESCRDCRFVFQNRDSIRPLEYLLVALLGIHVENVQALVELPSVPPDHLAVRAAGEELGSGFTVDPKDRVNAFPVTDFTRSAAHSPLTGSRVPCAALTI